MMLPGHAGRRALEREAAERRAASTEGAAVRPEGHCGAEVAGRSAAAHSGGRWLGGLSGRAPPAVTYCLQASLPLFRLNEGYFL